MELAQVCTKVPRYCPVPQRFKGRALEKVKSRRTTKKKSMVLSAWHKHNKKHAKPKRPKQRAVDEPLAHRPLCLRYCARTYSSDFQPYEASGPLCCLCGSLPDGEAVLHEQYVYSCRARVNVGGSWTSPQCTPASNPRPRSIRFAVSTYLFPPRGGASLLSLLLLLLVLTRPSSIIPLLAQPAGLGGDGTPFRKCLAFNADLVELMLARHWTVLRLDGLDLHNSLPLCCCLFVSGSSTPARYMFIARHLNTLPIDACNVTGIC
ncbi:hypothetical protein CI102_12902 [Trichoderma harzianum]|nr:hypothetical protein CI102_12902 [Trichoderma harzianum]